MNPTVEFWKQWIKLQLKHNLDRMVEQSIKNFHFPGLNYVCFDFTPHQTIRLYIVEPKDDLDTTAVNIHNHLYDSQLLVLEGWIKNTVYRINNDRDEYNCYHLTSALHPENKEKKIKLKFLTMKGLDINKELILLPGDSHFQPHTEIHNVANDPKNRTSFMVFEFPTVKKHSTLFSQKNLGTTIPTPGAYLRYEKEELHYLVTNMVNNV